MFDAMIQQGILLILLVSGLPLLGSAVIGFVVAVLQAATQIQEQSVPYLIKIAAAGLIGFVCHNWLWAKLVGFTQTLFSLIASLGQMP